MDKQDQDEGKGLHFLSSRENEVSTEDLSSEKQGLSVQGDTLKIPCLLRDN